MPNPLVGQHDLPPFSAIRAEHIEPAIRQVLDENRARLAACSIPVPTPGRRWSCRSKKCSTGLSRTWSPVGHMNGVVNSDELRAAYNACLPLLTAWHTDLAQNERLYRAYAHILRAEAPQLTARRNASSSRTHCATSSSRASACREERKQRFKAVMEQLATLQSKFDENVLDATNAWSRHVTSADGARRACRRPSSSVREQRRRRGRSGRLVVHARRAELPGGDDARRVASRCGASSTRPG